MTIADLMEMEKNLSSIIEKLSTLQMNTSAFLCILGKTHHIHTYVHGWVKLQPEQVNRDMQSKQESPPAWTQEAYHPPRRKYSLCCSVSEGGGGEGIPHPDLAGGYRI